MKKIILIILLSLTLNAETFDEYKQSVRIDIYQFQSKNRHYFENVAYQSFMKSNKIFSDAIKSSNYFVQTDLIVMLYLDYKKNVKQRINTMKFINRLINTQNKKIKE